MQTLLFVYYAAVLMSTIRTGVGRSRKTPGRVIRVRGVSGHISRLVTSHIGVQGGVRLGRLTALDRVRVRRGRGLVFPTSRLCKSG